MHCSNCGTYYSKVTRFCSKCGEELASPSGVLENDPNFYDNLGNLDPETQEAIDKTKETIKVAPDKSKLLLGLALSIFLGLIGLILTVVIADKYRKNGDASSASGMFFGAVIGCIFSTAITMFGISFIIMAFGN